MKLSTAATSPLGRLSADGAPSSASEQPRSAIVAQAAIAVRWRRTKAYSVPR